MNTCPCFFTEPCSDECACVNVGSSRSCQRCVGQGNLEQRANKARHLANKLDDTLGVWDLVRTFFIGYGVMSLIADVWFKLQ